MCFDSFLKIKKCKNILRLSSRKSHAIEWILFMCAMPDDWINSTNVKKIVSIIKNPKIIVLLRFKMMTALNIISSGIFQVDIMDKFFAINGTCRLLFFYHEPEVEKESGYY